MTYTVLVPDSLEEKGLQVLYATEGVEVNAPGKMNREQTLAAIPAAEALIVRSDTRVDRELLDQAGKLRFVVRAGVGVDNIDLDECTRRRIVVMNAPDGNTVSTAELTFGLILSLARHIPFADASMRAGRWDRKKFMGTQLAGKALGIIGFGRVGRAVAERAEAFGMTEVAYDPFVPERVARHLGLSIVPRLEDLFQAADIITLHALVTDETRGLINAENIAKMKDGVLIVNAARGKLVNSADLAAALKSGKVAGAAIDVYDVEPPGEENPLLGLPNVIYTPHLGASTYEAQEAVAEQAAQQVVNALLNDRFDNVRNRDVFDRL